MYCEACHERIKTGTSRCPSCGHAAKGKPDLGSASVRDTAIPTSYSLPPVPKLVQDSSREANEAEEVRQSPGEAKAKLEGVKQPSDEAKIKVEDVVQPPEPAARNAGPLQRPAAGSGSESTFELSPDGVRNLVIARPELIEAGLRVHTDGKGAASGARFETGVGRIDMLARDSGAGWVIVLVAESGQGKELVGDLLQLVGWVRKHLSAKGEEVRAVVLVDSVPEDLGYAAAAVSDTIEFRRYRVGLTLEKVEV